MGPFSCVSKMRDCQIDQKGLQHQMVPQITLISDRDHVDRFDLQGNVLEETVFLSLPCVQIREVSSRQRDAFQGPLFMSPF
jgi:hypothetical protein